MPELTPEQRARRQIDAQLVESGWIIQDYRQFNPTAGPWIALREVPLKTGPCDYLLLVHRKALGVIEARKEGTTLSTAADQSGRYLTTHDTQPSDIKATSISLAGIVKQIRESESDGMFKRIK